MISFKGCCCHHRIHSGHNRALRRERCLCTSAFVDFAPQVSVKVAVTWSITRFIFSSLLPPLCLSVPPCRKFEREPQSVKAKKVLFFRCPGSIQIILSSRIFVLLAVLERSSTFISLGPVCVCAVPIMSNYTSRCFPLWIVHSLTNPSVKCINQKTSSESTAFLHVGHQNDGWTNNGQHLPAPSSLRHQWRHQKKIRLKRNNATDLEKLRGGSRAKWRWFHPRVGSLPLQFRPSLSHQDNHCFAIVPLQEKLKKTGKSRSVCGCDCSAGTMLSSGHSFVEHLEKIISPDLDLTWLSAGC